MRVWTAFAVAIGALMLCAPARTAEALPWLHAEGTRILDERGKPVTLGGVNLGGWLVEEIWMMPIQARPPEGSGLKPVSDHVSLWATVEKRLGREEMVRVRAALRGAWIAEADFERIRAAGMNCVRLPFTCDLLEEPDGMSWIDRAIDLAARHGLYTILDLHGAPGRQSGEHHTGEAGVDRLFHEPTYVQQTVELWLKLAWRYRDRPEVAGYDLLNEPMGAPNAATLQIVQDKLYREIREVDDRHLIFVEDGYKGVDSLPDPAEVGWRNVVFSTHHYHFGAKTESDQVKAGEGLVASVTKAAQARGVPFFIGEFQQEPHGTPATMGAFIRAMEQSGVSWSVWTYKSAMAGGGGGMWGWYHSPKRLAPLDAFTDSAEEMLRKIEQVRTESLEENTGLTEAFRSARGSSSQSK